VLKLAVVAAETVLANVTTPGPLTLLQVTDTLLPVVPWGLPVVSDCPISPAVAGQCDRLIRTGINYRPLVGWPNDYGNVVACAQLSIAGVEPQDVGARRREGRA